MSITIFAAWAATALAVGTSAPASLAEATGPAWAGEARYWSDSERGDFADFIQLFSDRFTGWPCGASLPQAKSDIKGTIKGLQPGTVLDRKSTVVGPGLVITYYRATGRFRGDAGKIETVVTNITHTWVPTTEGWKIIGGMCRIAPAE
jgi:hypothetical protein